MVHNVETYQALGVERIVFTCSGCYETFKKEMLKVLGKPLPFETLHLVELVAEYVETGRVTFEAMPGGVVITYHDPCTLGRGLGIYESPRKIIDAIDGIVAHLEEIPIDIEVVINVAGNGNRCPVGIQNVAQPLRVGKIRSHEIPPVIRQSQLIIQRNVFNSLAQQRRVRRQTADSDSIRRVVNVGVLHRSAGQFIQFSQTT